MTSKSAQNWPGIAAIYASYLASRQPVPVPFPYPVKRRRKAYSLLLSVMLLSTVFSYSALAVEEDFLYDANGNLVQDGTFFYEYDGGNMLSRVREGNQSGRVVEEYWYDAAGQRVKKVHYLVAGGNETTYYVSGGFEVEVDENGSSTSTNYVFVNGERVAALHQNGSRTYFLDDHLGSSSVLVDEAGNVVDRLAYAPYGSLLTGGGATKYGYNNKELDDTGLNYYGARYYSSRILRWTQPDTLIQNIYDPQTLNRYSYVRNNPIRYTDPDGHIIPLLFVGLVGVGTMSLGFSALTGQRDLGTALVNAGAAVTGTFIAYVAAPAITVEAGVAQWTTKSIVQQAGANAMGAATQTGIENVYSGKDITNDMGQSAVIGAWTGGFGGVCDDFHRVTQGGQWAPNTLTSVLTTKTGSYYTKGVMGEEALQSGADYILDEETWKIKVKDKLPEQSQTVKTTQTSTSYLSLSLTTTTTSTTSSQYTSTYTSTRSSKYSWMVTGSR